VDCDNKKAVVQPRIHSALKIPLQDAVPLDTPFSAHIDISSICNFNCSFCFQADNEAMSRVGLKRGKMPLPLFKKIVDDLKAFNNKLKKVKIGNHGEPTLHPDMPEMIRYLKDTDITEIIEVFTNASKLEPDLNVKLIEAGVDRINISLEGMSSEHYEKVAGVKIDFDAMIRNIAHLHSVRGNAKIYIKIADQTRPLKKYGNELFVLSKRDRDQFFAIFGSICDEIYIEKVVPQWAETQLDRQNDLDATGMYGQAIKNYKEVCPFIFMYLHFNWDGTTSPCTLDWAKKVIIGNVYEQSVLDIWNGKSLRDLRVAMLLGKRDRIELCQNCSAPMVCVEDDLDPYKESILKVMSVNVSAQVKNNSWIF